MNKPSIITTIALAATLLAAAPVAAQAADDRPVCVVRVADALIAHYGPQATAACDAADQLTGQMVYGARTHGTLECTILSTPDVVSAYTQGHAAVVFDASKLGSDTAMGLCNLAVSQGQNVINQDWLPYGASQ